MGRAGHPRAASTCSREGNARSWRFLEITGVLDRALPELAEAHAPPPGRPLRARPDQRAALVAGRPPARAREPTTRAAAEHAELEHPEWLLLAALILDAAATDEPPVDGRPAARAAPRPRAPPPSRRSRCSSATRPAARPPPCGADGARRGARPRSSPPTSTARAGPCPVPPERWRCDDLEPVRAQPPRRATPLVQAALGARRADRPRAPQPRRAAAGRGRRGSPARHAGRASGSAHAAARYLLAQQPASTSPARPRCCEPLPPRGRVRAARRRCDGPAAADDGGGSRSPARDRAGLLALVDRRARRRRPRHGRRGGRDVGRRRARSSRSWCAPRGAARRRRRSRRRSPPASTRRSPREPVPDAAVDLRRRRVALVHAVRGPARRTGPGCSTPRRRVRRRGRRRARRARSTTVERPRRRPLRAHRPQRPQARRRPR